MKGTMILALAVMVSMSLMAAEDCETDDDGCADHPPYISSAALKDVGSEGQKDVGSEGRKGDDPSDDGDDQEGGACENSFSASNESSSESSEC